MAANTTAKILIVDDEAYMRRLIEQTLEELEDIGVELLKADNGEDALQLIQAQHPRLVFMDVMIPKMNGFEVSRIVKRELHLDDIAIVILTAKGQEYDRQIGDAVGAELYMTKPFDPDELLALAKKLLRLDVSSDLQ